MNIFDGFSGIGGFSLAIKRAGFEIENHYASEVDKYAQWIYRKQFPGSVQLGDVCKIGNEHGKIDIITFGFPCQSFSIAGKRRGFEDTRGTMFFEIARLATVYEPKIMLLENVKGLMSHDNGNTLKIILETLQSLGYYVNIDLYNTVDYGIPQNRERMFFICYHTKGLLKDGKTLNINLLEIITKQWLFQILQKNLEEVKMLQDAKSKDWVLNYLLLKEVLNMCGQLQMSNTLEKIIKQCHVMNSQDICPSLFPLSIEKKENWISVESILESIMTTTEGYLFLLEKEELNHCIDILLNKILEENFPEQNKSTILTVLKTITNSKTYTFTTMQAIILKGIGQLRNYYPNFWKEILSDLIVIQEGTKYARINEKNENRIVTEYNTVIELNDFKSLSSKKFICTLAGERQPEISHIREAKRENIKDNIDIFKKSGERKNSSIAATLTAGAHSGGNHPDMDLIRVGTLRNYKGEPPFREMASGVSPTLKARAREAGDMQPVIIQDVLRSNKSQNGKGYKTDSFYTLTSQAEMGVLLSDSGQARKRELRNIAPPLRAHDGCGHDNYATDNTIIRRLTPIECERLQAYPDDWTQYGINDNGEQVEISDTQRYKTLGNSISVIVAEEIFKSIKVVI